MEVLGQVDEAVNQLVTKQYVQLSLLFGGKYYQSVTTGFACVDIRKYYFTHTTKEVKPCKKGIALRIPECVALKDVVSTTTEQETCGVGLLSIRRTSWTTRISKEPSTARSVTHSDTTNYMSCSNCITISQFNDCGEDGIVDVFIFV